MKSNKAMLSAGVVLIRYFEGIPYFLLLRAYKYWDFPKGEVEAGEDPLDTAMREVREETTLADLSFAWGRDFRETPVYGKGKVARYYVALSQHGDVDLPINLELGHPEHHEYRWLVYAQARELLNERLRPILDWAHACIAES